MFFEMSNVTKSFGGLVANKDISVEIAEGEIVGLIGPNGAGKSTMFKTVTGFHIPDSGSISFGGKDITKYEPNKICQVGISCTFQKSQLFSALTLEESVLVGAYCRHKRKSQALPLAHRMIEFVGLGGKEEVKISKLNMFERKKAELAAALATEPKLLLLDELFAGLVPTEVELMLELVKKINEEFGTALFIVEHVLRVIMGICTKVYVLEYGQLIAVGTPEEVTSSEVVIKAYLGDDDFYAATDIKS
ncbi:MULTISPECIES: ABC transporter ATP-binding protein [Neobacillus]|uniref:ABC transporter ATP-binding protein n=1 Tax=Neobacillus rhizophilus TaxID=2833579 RepID=A0A942U8A9_9BACI|nr:MULTISPECIES: ATP-binding cassette domain-containing protein [Neobacillus]MBS4212724.1 ABC transporter ATP-binding protein [Neobacillus rhizophilus]